MYVCRMSLYYNNVSVTLCVCRDSEPKDKVSWSSDEDSSSAAPVATSPHAQKASLSDVLRRPSLDTEGQGSSGILPTAHGPLLRAHSDIGGTESHPEAPPPSSLGVLSGAGSSGNLKVASLGLDLSAGFQSDEEEEEEEEDSVELATKPPLSLPPTLSSPPPLSSSPTPQHAEEKGGSEDRIVEKELDLSSEHEVAPEDEVASFLSRSGGVVPSPSQVSALSAKHSSGISGQVPSLNPKLGIGDDFDSGTDSEAELPKPQSGLFGETKAEPSSNLQQSPSKEEEWSDVSEGGDDDFLVASGRKASKYFEEDAESGDEQVMLQKQPAGAERTKDLAAEMFGLTELGGEGDEEESNFDSDVDLPEEGEGGYVPSAFGGDSQQRSSTALLEEGSVMATPSSRTKDHPPSPGSPPVQLGGADTPTSSLLSPTSLTQTVVVTPLTAATSTPLVLDHQEKDITMATQPHHQEVKAELDFGLEGAGTGGAVGVSELEEKEVDEEEDESDWDSDEEEEEEGGKGVRCRLCKAFTMSAMCVYVCSVVNTVPLCLCLCLL